MSDIPVGIETLDFSFSGGRRVGAFAPVLVGVVGSGPRVMLEAADGRVARAETSARGFGRSGKRWPRLLRRHPSAACASRSTTWAPRPPW